MAYCPYCGTFNREGSKFCNECGGALQGETRACEACGTRNPVTSRFCGGCGALVAPVTAIAPVVAPISPAVQTEAAKGFVDVEDEELPSLEADFPPPSFAAPSEQLAEPAVTIAEPVAESGGEAVGEPDGALTVEDELAIDWYAALRPDEWAVGEAPRITEVAQRRELVEMGTPTAGLEPAEEVTSEPSLAATGEAEAPTAAAPALPDFEADVRLPDWLESPASTVGAVDIVATGTPTALEEVVPALPDWLEIEEPETSARATVVTGPLPELPDLETPLELPGWLEDMDRPVAVAVVEQVAAPEDTAPAPLPSWLFVEEAVAEAGAAVAEQAEAMPEVATRVAAVSTEAVTEELGAAGRVELPGWLLAEESSIAGQEVAGLTAETTATSEAPAEAVEEGAVLETAMAAAPTPLVDAVLALPDWLELPEEPASMASEGRPAAAVAGVAEGPILPDWLRFDELELPGDEEAIPGDSMLSELPVGRLTERTMEELFGEGLEDEALDELVEVDLEAEQASTTGSDGFLDLVEEVAANFPGAIPDWLRASGGPATEEAPRGEKAEASGERPAREGEEEAVAAAEKVPAFVVEPNLPSWLLEVEPGWLVEGEPPAEARTAEMEPTAEEATPVTVGETGLVVELPGIGVEAREDVALPEWLEMAETVEPEASLTGAAAIPYSGEGAPAGVVEGPEGAAQRMAELEARAAGEEPAASDEPAWLTPPVVQEELAGEGWVVPGWLGEDAETPAWARPAVEEEAAETPAGTQADRLPEWLTLTEAAAEPEVAVAETAGESDLPASLVESEPVSALPTWRAEREEDSGLPDWLMEGDEASPVQEGSAPAAVPVKEGAVPFPRASTAGAEGDRDGLGGGLPDWLLAAADVDGPGLARPEAGPMASGGAGAGGFTGHRPEAPSGAEVGVPFVVDVEHSRRRQGLVDTDVAEAAFPEIIEQSDLPAWLTGQAGGEGEAPTAVAVAEAAEAGEETSEAGDQAQAGPGEEIPPGIALAKTFQSVRFPPGLTKETAPAGAYGELFSEVFGSGPAAKERREGKPGRIAPRIVMLLLLAAVVLPFFVLPLRLDIPGPQGIGGTREVIDRLPLGSAVLVSFDWNGNVNDEMAPVARALVRHLVSRQAKIIAVSVVPEGGKLAQLTLEHELVGKGYAYGRDWVVLGYCPGNEMAVGLLLNDLPARAYAADFAGQSVQKLPLLRQVEDLKDIGLVVDIAGEAETMRWWVRQFQSSEALADGGARLVGGVTAAAGPEMSTYRNSRQLAGLVVGVAGAAQYDRGGEDMTTFLNAQSYAGIVIVLCVVAGNLIYRFRRSKA